MHYPGRANITHTRSIDYASVSIFCRCSDEIRSLYCCPYDDDDDDDTYKYPCMYTHTHDRAKKESIFSIPMCACGTAAIESLTCILCSIRSSAMGYLVVQASAGEFLLLLLRRPRRRRAPISFLLDVCLLVISRWSVLLSSSSSSCITNRRLIPLFLFGLACRWLPDEFFGSFGCLLVALCATE